ncbi:MAG: glycogen debranching enzyme family protein [Chloracidobacterium sp.]|nr:glycogen debranching enzyme family protein [Chloracidobacterium sp.]
MINLSKKVLNDLETSTSREWIETNGIGGYASGTVSGAHTRRYHGLLVAATKPPLGRMVLLSKFEETLVIDGNRFDLSTNQYPGMVHPQGYRLFTGFRLEPFPIWTFKVDGIEIEKKIFMSHGSNTTIASWTVKKRKRYDKRQVMLELRPLFAFRDHHHLRREDEAFSLHIDSGDGYVSFKSSIEDTTLYLTHNAVSLERSNDWYRNFEYTIEQERGFDFTEDLFQSCVFSFDLSEPATVIASTELQEISHADSLEATEIERRARLVHRSGLNDDFSTQLVLAADQFIVKRGEGHTIIAGYHWFSDWGRDTMIALPGLTLATGRPEIAKSILAEFAKHISEGMIPNRFPDEGETPEYNTVDATLWFFEAIRAYAEKTEDYKFVRDQLYAKLIDIIDWHMRGTRYNIRVDTDGLLYAGGPSSQLTWMDAKIGDWVVTPRTGKPVEIQALWFNTLCFVADLAKRFGDKNENRYREMAAAAKASFNGQFWNDEENCLYDVVDGANKDASVRPNQIFAVSLQHTMLDEERARAVVKKVQAELLTEVGLRSLTPNDPRFVAIYKGLPRQRDGAYHQGTVWAWLIGPFIEAYRKTHSQDAKAQIQITQMLSGFKQHISDTMLGQISEIFDAQQPHYPRGAAAQAWSVAELLRIGNKE